MVKRLLYGLVFGLFVGGLLAAAVVKGLGMAVFAGTSGAILAYVFAAVTGVLVGLVAGKPIWAAGGQIEAGLKAVAGALVGAAAMFAMRRWLSLDLDLHSLGLGSAAAGDLPAITLPAIAAVLGAFYEADNTPAPDDKNPKSKGKPSKKVRVADDDEEAAEDEDLEPRKAAAKK